MILETSELTLLREILALRTAASRPLDPYATSLGEERASRDRDRRDAALKLEQFFACAVAASDTLALPDGVEHIGATPGPRGVLLWFNSAPLPVSGKRTTFCLPLGELIASRNTSALLAEQATKEAQG